MLTHMQFGYGAGMLHVIDDESKFDSSLARQVGAGRCGCYGDGCVCV